MNDINRKNMVKARNKFKNRVRKCKKLYEIKETSKLEMAKLKNAREYWKLLKGNKKEASHQISAQEFYNYFHKIFNADYNAPNTVPKINELSDLEGENVLPFHIELDNPITVLEVKIAIK